MTGFILINTDRDRRFIRQTFAKSLGPVGCLVLVSTTVYSNVERPARPGQPAGGRMSTEEMITMVPIETITESLAYVPGVEIRNKQLEPIGIPTLPPQVPEDE